VLRLQVSAIAPFASQLNDPSGVCFQEASDDHGNDGVDDEEEDVDAELQALAEVVQNIVYFCLAFEVRQYMTRYIWCCRRLVRTLRRLTLFWEIPTTQIRSLLTAAVMNSCKADMQVYSSVY